MLQVMNNFNFIWYMHHLVLVLLALIMMHPKPHIPDEKNEWGYSDVWAWIGRLMALQFPPQHENHTYNCMSDAR